jgi:hypothetical protein
MAAKEEFQAAVGRIELAVQTLEQAQRQVHAIKGYDLTPSQETFVNRTIQAIGNEVGDLKLLVAFTDSPNVWNL